MGGYGRNRLQGQTGRLQVVGFHQQQRHQRRSFHKLPYDIREFALVTMVSEVPHRVTVHPSLPAKTVKGLIMMAKDNTWGGYSSQPIVAPW